MIIENRVCIGHMHYIQSEKRVLENKILNVCSEIRQNENLRQVSISHINISEFSDYLWEQVCKTIEHSPHISHLTIMAVEFWKIQTVKQNRFWETLKNSPNLVILEVPSNLLFKSSWDWSQFASTLVYIPLLPEFVNFKRILFAPSERLPLANRAGYYLRVKRSLGTKMLSLKTCKFR